MNFKNLIKIEMIEIKKETIIHYPEIRELCGRPYPNNPNGCMNNIKCSSLEIPTFNDIQKSDNYNHFYLVYARFDFFKYWLLRLFQAIKTKSLEFWTTNRLKSLLYWQNSVKKLIKEFINNLYITSKVYILGCGSAMKLKHQEVVGSMENSCINVFSTMKLNGIIMEINPKYTIYLVCLISSHDKIENKKEKRMF